MITKNQESDLLEVCGIGTIAFHFFHFTTLPLNHFTT